MNWCSLLFILVLIPMTVQSRDPSPVLEHDLNYALKTPILEEGNFQYFYTLLRQKTASPDFENLNSDQSVTPVAEILRVFLPLDSEKLWKPEERNFLALARFTFILPMRVESIDEAVFAGTEYLQKTLPRYKVTKTKKGFHVGGSFITPDFDATVSFLTADDPLIPSLTMASAEKMRAGKMKVSFMHQKNFGRVMMFQTAKMANALLIYEELTSSQTLVNQFILSNVINVPTRDLIRRGMIENLTDVVRGSRAFFSSK